MCGLVAAVGKRDVIPVLIHGLKHLEYRGYDSAGVATLSGQNIYNQRSVGKVSQLEEKLASIGMSGTIGIGHTRWATHGPAQLENAHPHISNNLIAVVHNGIIENYESLRRELESKNYHFDSETDTEVIAHLIHYYLQTTKSLLKAVKKATADLKGSYAIAVISSFDPQTVIGARCGSPLLVGVGRGENFLASDTMALLHITKHFIYLEEGDIAELTNTTVNIYDGNGRIVARDTRESAFNTLSVDKGSYPHFMLKEIFEQGKAITETLIPHTEDQRVSDSTFGESSLSLLSRVQNVQIIACGTSYHAGLVASYIIESLAHMPCRVEMASEYLYRTPVVRPNTLCVFLSQSGETADTLSALRHSQCSRYLATLSICNVRNSSLVRESDFEFITAAGPEIGVASTKAFTTQLVSMNLLAILLARLSGLSRTRESALVKSLRESVVAVERVLQLNNSIRLLAEMWMEKDHTLYLGRGSMYPMAMEGALKLKEISYVHAEAYPAGELKHGPLALVDKEMPVVALAPTNPLLSKVKGNLQEVIARGAKPLVVTDNESGFQVRDSLSVIHLPQLDDLISPIVYAIPLQLLAYYVAVLKGTNVDQPRNLAKSVTVE